MITRRKALKLGALSGLALSGGLLRTGQALANRAAAPGDSALWKDYTGAKATGREPILPDFSYAGYHYSNDPIPDVPGPIFDVTARGADATGERYSDDAIQATINAAQEAGGGVVFFPRGQFKVNPDSNPDAFIGVSGSGIILRGSGSADGGTEIFMDKYKVDDALTRSGVMFRVAPPPSNSRTLATVVADSGRETFWVQVDDVSRLAVGQRVILRYLDPAYNDIYWPPLELNPEWSRLFESGFPVNESHSIVEIKNDQVRFHEPLHIGLTLNSAPFTLRSAEYLEEVGIEDIRFRGNWDSYPEEFVHHKDVIHDAGWSILQINRLANGWMRRCEFRNCNQAVHMDGAVAFTLDRVRITGKPGHTGIAPRRGYGVLSRDCEDQAPMHHGPGFGYQGTGTVYLRFLMQPDQRIDSHGGVPYTDLLDAVTGGQLSGNGGPLVNLPHHARHFVFWNFLHRSGVARRYDFWNLARRENNTFALPIFAGLVPDRDVTFLDEADKVQVNESFGSPVTPTSLFEAQLALRQG